MITAIIVNGEWHNDSCVEKCTEECEAKCPEVKSCNEEEIDCGPSARPENPFCDADRICVASNCNCKFYTYGFTLKSLIHKVILFKKSLYFQTMFNSIIWQVLRMISMEKNVH